MFDDDRHYHVVHNALGQYAIWPADRRPPAGWHRDGRARTRVECAERIQHRWTDIRPAPVAARPALATAEGSARADA